MIRCDDQQVLLSELLQEYAQPLVEPLQFIPVSHVDQVLANALNNPVDAAPVRKRGRPRKTPELPAVPPASQGEGSSRMSQ